MLRETEGRLVELMSFEQEFLVTKIEEYTALANLGKDNGWRWLSGDDLLSEDMIKMIIFYLKVGDVHIRVNLTGTSLVGTRKTFSYTKAENCNCAEKGVKVYSFPDFPPVVLGNDRLTIDNVPEEI